jgi:beta-phosphoglucomutase-like phosphatase (HAD superfamily)
VTQTVCVKVENVNVLTPERVRVIGVHALPMVGNAMKRNGVMKVANKPEPVIVEAVVEEAAAVEGEVAEVVEEAVEHVVVLPVQQIKIVSTTRVSRNVTQPVLRVKLVEPMANVQTQTIVQAL